MALKAPHKYHGNVREGSEIIETKTGTMGYQVQLECEDGYSSYTIWLTPKNRERAFKTFTEALGVDPENLTNSNYIEYQLALDIAGKEVTFVTEEEEYNEKKRIKVAWLFKRSAAAQGASRAVASFFGPQAPAKVTATDITDDDIPF